MAGICTMIGLAEGAHLGAIARGQSVSDFTKYFCLLLGALLILLGLFFIAVKLFGKKGKEAKKSSDANAGKLDFLKSLTLQDKLLWGVFGLLLAGQVILILFSGRIFQEQDLTLETVMSFLQTGKLYEINPMTGAPYEMGLPTRLKILCLPTLYASLSTLPKVRPEDVVWHFVPFITLVASYLAYTSLGRTLFPKSGRHLGIFLLIVSLLVYAGAYGYGMEGFGLLHVGFQGTTIRSAVLLPYLFSLCLRRKWKLAILAVAAEACIVWTFYGLGIGILIFAIFVGWELGLKLVKGRKEGTVWNS
ncbi:MAG: hypothetical protein J6Z22_10070 [Lachnospiraceae bacterium]|nr:hypothetical protein [Lachnospiraceae bacterium]